MAPRPAAEPDEPPPLGRTWERLYLVVLAHLGLWIALLLLFTWLFA